MPAPARLPDHARDALLAWYRTEGRHDLPWRTTRDPYAVLVSEVMLQQTQVDRVVPKYREFLAAFPTVESLARAPAADVIRIWGTLGYNRRAVRLHDAALAIVDAGGVPREVDRLRALPGIGAYTAAAVASFAFDGEAAVVDTNVRRVIGRALAGDDGIGEGAARRLAAAALPGAGHRDWNLALMDLGATVCTARAPRCDACPLAAICARLRTNVGGDPRAVGERRPAYRAKAERFAGSRRYYRGRIVAALRSLGDGTTIGLPELGRALREGYDEREHGGWLRELVESLASDGLAAVEGDGVRLP